MYLHIYLLKRVQRHPKGLEGPLSPSKELEGWAHCAQSSSFTNHEILAQNFMHKFNLFFVMEIMISWLQNTGYGKVGETLQAKFYLIVNDGRKLFNEKWFQIYNNLLYQGCKVLEDINEVLLLSGVHRRMEVIVISNWHYVA